MKQNPSSQTHDTQRPRSLNSLIVASGCFVNVELSRERYVVSPEGSRQFWQNQGKEFAEMIRTWEKVERTDIVVLYDCALCGNTWETDEGVPQCCQAAIDVYEAEKAWKAGVA